jgi:hypothetical protein
MKVRNYTIEDFAHLMTSTAFELTEVGLSAGTANVLKATNRERDDFLNFGIVPDRVIKARRLIRKKMLKDFV